MTHLFGDDEEEWMALAKLIQQPLGGGSGRPAPGGVAAPSLTDLLADLGCDGSPHGPALAVGPSGDGKHPPRRSFEDERKEMEERVWEFFTAPKNPRREACVCGAHYTSFPDIHSEWCPLS